MSLVLSTPIWPVTVDMRRDCTSVRPTGCIWDDKPHWTNHVPMGCGSSDHNNLQLYCEVREKSNKMQQSDVYYQHWLNMFRASVCPSSLEQRPCVTACGVLRWFCWMWLVAVVGRCVAECEHTCWDSVDNKHLIVASCWLSLSLYNLLTMHGHRNRKPATLPLRGPDLLCSGVQNKFWTVCWPAYGGSVFWNTALSVVGFYFATMCPSNYVPVVDSVLVCVKQCRWKCLELNSTEKTFRYCLKTPQTFSFSAWGACC